MIRGKPRTLPGTLPSCASSARPSPDPRAYYPPYRSARRNDLKLLVRMPTRGRPEQALSVLKKYRDLSGCPVMLELVVDDDDSEMARHAEDFATLGMDFRFTVGRHTSKIDAVNDGCVDDWDVLLLASDDMVPMREGYGARVLDAMAERFPLLDGAIYFDDGYVGQKLCTLPIFGRRLYEQFGYVYFPEYKSFFCDNEQTDLLLSMGRLSYVPEHFILHRHPANVHARAPVDGVYLRNSTAWGHDEALYKARRVQKRPYAQFVFDSPPLWLSILIPTVSSRASLLEPLVDYLFKQALAHPREVEILVDPRERVTIGEKRNALIDRAKGHYVAHVDDDDWVSPDYVARILAAVKAKPDADCCSLRGIMTTDGRNEATFLESLEFSTWGRRNGTFTRCPTQRCAVRTSIAKEVRFPAISYGEDEDFSKRLRARLSKEASTGSEPLYFYRFQSGKPRSWYYGS